jgi:hypothetical protein
MAAMQMGDPGVLNSSLDMGGDPLGFVVVNVFKLFTGK